MLPPLDRESEALPGPFVEPRSWLTMWSVWYGQFPLKRLWALIGKLFVEGQPESERFQIGKLIGSEDLPLDNSEVDFNLIEPTGVDWRMDHNETGIHLLQALYRGCSAMRRAMVDEPEQPCAGTVRFLCQHLVDQSAKGFHPGCRFTAVHHIPAAH